MLVNKKTTPESNKFFSSYVLKCSSLALTKIYSFIQSVKKKIFYCFSFVYSFIYLFISINFLFFSLSIYVLLYKRNDNGERFVWKQYWFMRNCRELWLILIDWKQIIQESDDIPNDNIFCFIANQVPHDLILNQSKIKIDQLCSWCNDDVISSLSKGLHSETVPFRTIGQQVLLCWWMKTRTYLVLSSLSLQ